MARQSPNNGECIKPDCNRGITSRGLCQKHYFVALKLVRNGKITWDELMKRGKVLYTHTMRDSAEQAWFLEKGSK